MAMCMHTYNGAACEGGIINNSKHNLPCAICHGTMVYEEQIKYEAKSHKDTLYTYMVSNCLSLKWLYSLVCMLVV